MVTLAYLLVRKLKSENQVIFQTLCAWTLYVAFVLPKTCVSPILAANDSLSLLSTLQDVISIEIGNFPN